MSEEFSLQLSATPESEHSQDQSEFAATLESEHCHDQSDFSATPGHKYKLLMQAIRFAEEIALYQASMELLQIDRDEMIKVLRETPSDGIEDHLAEVQRLIKKASILCEEAKKKHAEAHAQYQSFVLAQYAGLMD